MKINIKATNIELSEAITEYLTQKVNSLEKFISEPSDSVFCDAEIGKTTRHHKEGDIYKAELNISMSGSLIRAEAERENLYAAIDQTRDEMAQSLKKKRNRKMVLIRKGALKIKNILKGFKW